MARTKQTARKQPRGKPQAMGRGKNPAKKPADPKPGGRTDRKVIAEYSSDESPDEESQQVGGKSTPKRVK